MRVDVKPNTDIATQDGRKVGSYNSGVAFTRVDKIPSAITISANNPTILSGQNITFTANFLGENPSPTGSVNLMSGGTSLVTAQLFNGSIELHLTALPLGADSFTAQYVCVSNHSAATSQPVIVTVLAQMLQPTITLSSPSTEVVTGSSFIVTVSVASDGTSIPTGEVVLIHAGKATYYMTLKNGTEFITLGTSAAGTHTFTAEYLGDEIHAAATLVSRTVTVTDPQITVSPASGALSDANIGEAYSARFDASGGTASNVYSLSSGTLPSGLKLSSAGVLSGAIGTQTQAASYYFTIREIDVWQTSASASYTLAVKAAGLAAASSRTIPQVIGSPTNVDMAIGATRVRTSSPLR